jgi:hypothetical protein
MIATTLVIGILFAVTGPMVGMFWDSINPMMPANTMQTMSMLNNVFGWTFLVLLIGTFAYGAALAAHRDPVDIQG